VTPAVYLVWEPPRDGTGERLLSAHREEETAKRHARPWHRIEAWWVDEYGASHVEIVREPVERKRFATRSI